jgi:hypothetical protein
MAHTRRIALAVMTLLVVCIAKAESQNDSLAMDSIVRSLPEIMIKGERPVAVVHGSTITYDLPQLIEKKGADNVYDAIKELPGAMEQGDGFQLAGRTATVAINGQVLSMTQEQIAALLKSLPASRIDKAEVAYNAPAKYQVHGALINIKLKKKTATGAPMESEINVAYNQKHDATFGERASLLYHKGKLTIDAMYLHNHGREYGVTDEDSHHSLSDGSIHDIKIHQTQLTKLFSHNYRIGAEYDFADNHTLALAYQGNFNDNDIDNNYSGEITGNTLTQHRTWLHNLRLDYTSPLGTKAGAETTYYHDPESQILTSSMPTGTLNFNADNDQRVNRLKLYIAQEHQLKNGWSINYGAWYKLSLNHNRQKYEDKTESHDNYLRLREDVVNIYGGTSKNFGNKLIGEASIATEYYHTDVWNKWNVYPTLNLTYIPNPNNTWMLSFTNDRTYPEYWAMNNFTVYGNGGYDEITGNPYLKPSSQYQSQIVYIVKNKYQFAAWFNYTDDYFVQTPYQRPDRLAVEFRSLNFNYQQQAGLQAAIPHKFSSWLDTRLTLTGVWMHEKCDDYYDIPFDRAIFYGVAQLKNAITLSTKHDITLNIDGMIRSKAKQAIFDLPGSGSLNLGVRWTFWKKQAIVHAFCNDLFETSAINPQIDFKGQKMKMSFDCYRQFGISVTIRLGGYKEKKHEEVDVSRYRK